MRVLVAESVAREGIDLLAAHHEVDERIGCTREELGAISTLEIVSIANGRPVEPGAAVAAAQRAALETMGIVAARVGATA